MKIDPGPEGLDGCDHSGHKFASRDRLKITMQGVEGRAAEHGPELPVVLEEDLPHPGDGEDDLTVRNIEP
ncbi:MAG: hypothetical protein ACUVRL_11130 [Candidatus Saccharicenans sp.]|uniref:hypothetical protein n=1 Tax=Candidatus Saccharicenans sp. TaxID=2819258 RepID=UPI004048EACC